MCYINCAFAKEMQRNLNKYVKSEKESKKIKKDIDFDLMVWYISNAFKKSSENILNEKKVEQKNLKKNQKNAWLK